MIRVGVFAGPANDLPTQQFERGPSMRLSTDGQDKGG
jgi:hypothetical protein